MLRFLFQRAIVRKTRIASGLQLGFLLPMEVEYELTLHWKKQHYSDPSIFVKYNPAELCSSDGKSVKRMHERD